MAMCAAGPCLSPLRGSLYIFLAETALFAGDKRLPQQRELITTGQQPISNLGE